MPIQSAGGVKPFILECPDHGGAMVPAEENVLVCLVPCCKKRARRAFKHSVSEAPGTPSAHFNTLQQEVSIGGRKFDVADLEASEFSTAMDEYVVRKYFDAMSEPPKELFEDAHGHVWFRNS